MPFDPDSDRAPEAAARAVAERDPHLAAVLLAECARLRDDNEETRARERAALHQASTCSQLTFIGKRVFVDNLTLLRDDDRAYVWLYEDDIVSLADGPHRSDPWEHNVEAERQLRKCWRERDASLVSSIRVCLFEGTDRMARVTRELGAADLVTHLDLRVQKAGAVIESIASTFPKLRGLSCRASDLDALLADGAPELRSLVVYLESTNVLDLALRAPKLRHLGLLHGRWYAGDVAELASHPIMNRVMSLDLFDVNNARTFPFAEVRARREVFEHLTRVYLPSHLVPPEVKATLDAPTFTFVTWDRREAIAVDFETTGWGADAR